MPEEGEGNGYSIQEGHIYKDVGETLRVQSNQEQLIALLEVAKRGEFAVVLALTPDVISMQEERARQIVTQPQESGVTVETLISG